MVWFGYLFGGHTHDAQGLLLALHSGITVGVTQESIQDTGNENLVVLVQGKHLPIVLLLRP